VKTMFIAVHPDDETLGCGGTILKKKSQGDEVFWLIITEASKEVGYNDEFIKKRKKQIQKVSKLYQFSDVVELKYPSTKLHLIDFNDLLKSISSVISSIKPDSIFSVNKSDIHTDHQITAKAVFSATKSFRCPFVKNIFMYECISETEFSPPFNENAFLCNAFVDVSNFFKQKIDIMKIYDTELQMQPLPRSIENISALATFRGSIISVKYAEAFMVIRSCY
jgi:N-acetylglucosamine malate deacetylase 1